MTKKMVCILILSFAFARVSFAGLYCAENITNGKNMLFFDNEQGRITLLSKTVINDKINLYYEKVADRICLMFKNGDEQYYSVCGRSEILEKEFELGNVENKNSHYLVRKINTINGDEGKIRFGENLQCRWAVTAEIEPLLRNELAD